MRHSSGPARQAERCGRRTRPAAWGPHQNMVAGRRGNHRRFHRVGIAGVPGEPFARPLILHSPSSTQLDAEVGVEPVQWVADAAENLYPARMQMAVSLGWHIIFSCFGIAFPVLTVFAEWRGHKRG